MHLVAILFISAIGLGHIISKATGLKKMWGYQAAIGYALVPISIFILHMVLGINIKISAQITALSALLGFIHFILEIRLSIKDFMRHPLIIWGIPFTVIFFAFGPTNYIPTGTDEFSHWLTMPMQMFLENSLLSKEFAVKDFASYTPGWPILNIYADLVLSSQFDYSQIVYVAFFSGIVCVAALYDFLKQYLGQNYNSILTLSFILCLVLYKAFTPKNILIEIPMYHAILLFFITTALLLKDQTKNIWFIYLSILTVYSYLLKHAFLTLVPLLPLVIVLSTRWNLKNLFLRFLVLVCPVVIFFLIWNISYKSLQVPDLFPPVPIKSLQELRLLLSERSEIFSNLPHQLLRVWNRLSFIPQLALLVFFIGHSFIERRLFYLIFSYFCIYLLSLLWMYLTGFGLYEALILASFERYLSIPLAVILFFGSLNLIYLFFKHILRKVDLTFFQNLNHDISQVWLSLTCGLLICVLMILKPYKDLKIDPHSMLLDFSSFQKFISEKNFESPNVLIISQGSVNLEYQIGRFLSIGSDKYLFRIIHDGTSFSYVKENVWQTVLTPSKMKDLILSADVVWLVKSDLWMDEILNSLVAGDSCNLPYDQYFIFKNETRLECARK